MTELSTLFKHDGVFSRAGGGRVFTDKIKVNRN